MMCAQIDSRWALVMAIILLVADGACSLLGKADRDVYPVFEYKRIKVLFRLWILENRYDC
jgi:hypothetical protein